MIIAGRLFYAYEICRVLTQLSPPKKTKAFTPPEATTISELTGQHQQPYRAVSTEHLPHCWTNNQLVGYEAQSDRTTPDYPPRRTVQVVRLYGLGNALTVTPLTTWSVFLW